MYNYQTYLRSSRVANECQQIRENFYKDQTLREKSAQAMIHSHKKRIEGFILSMIDKPIPVQIFKNPQYQPRPVNNDENIGPHALVRQFRHEKQRIQETVSQNSIYDGKPFNNTFSHKFRDMSGEGTVPMRFKPACSALRVKESVDGQTQNYLITTSNKKLDKMARTASSWKDSTLSKSMSRSLLPQLHQKTYFTSLNTIYAEAPNSFIKHGSTYVMDKEPADIKYDDDADYESKKQVQKTNNDHMSRKENCREALIKCGMVVPTSNIRCKSRLKINRM